MADPTFAMIVPLGGRGPVDPGYGGGIPNMPGIDNSLPPAPPNTPPGVIWPPLHPNRPDQGLPPFQGRPDNTLPGSQPGIDNTLPRPPSGGRPDNTLPGQPARPDNTLPSQKYWVVIGVPGYGWRWTCIDPSLTIDNTLPAQPPPGVDNTLPPAAQPKR